MAQDDKTDTDDLVERLEDSKTSPNLFMAAAARFRELEAENARLKNALIATRNDLHEINAGDLSTFEVQDAISAALEEKNDDE